MNNTMKSKIVYDYVIMSNVHSNSKSAYHYLSIRVTLLLPTNTNTKNPCENYNVELESCWPMESILNVKFYVSTVNRSFIFKRQYSMSIFREKINIFTFSDFSSFLLFGGIKYLINRFILKNILSVQNVKCQFREK